MNLHAVILAGGRGERFWPLSRARSPKQLLRLVGAQTMLGETLSRIGLELPPERAWVILSSDLEAAVAPLQLPVHPERWLWEPVGRNTAAAIGASVELIQAIEPTAQILAVPSDHWIPDPVPFWTAVRQGREVLARGTPLVTFGLRPLYAEPGYGYIEQAEEYESCPGAFRVARFHEKPDAARAQSYLESGRFFWNSGIFLFQAAAMAELLRIHVPALAPPLDRLRAAVRGSEEGRVPPEDWRRYFEEAPAISIDHGVMEHARDVAVIDAGFAWSDLGSWSSLADKLPSDAGGNHTRGDTMACDSEGCVLFSEEGGLLAVLGVRDLIVVRVGDATLVCPRDRAQEVRRLVQEGKADERLRRFF